MDQFTFKMLSDSYLNVYDSLEHPFYGVNSKPYKNVTDEEIYGSDIFRMYGFKIKRCTRKGSHDWTECPFAHRGEKATRRDPSKFPYSPITCSAFRDGNGKCLRGDTCEFAHGVFEYWLHPAKYRTRPCNLGTLCERKYCFFAHTVDQLRPEPWHNCPLTKKARMNKREHATVISEPVIDNPGTSTSKEKFYDYEVSQLEKRLRGVKIGKEREKTGETFEVSDLDMHNIEWISKLVD